MTDCPNDLLCKLLGQHTLLANLPVEANRQVGTYKHSGDIRYIPENLTPVDKIEDADEAYTYEWALNPAEVAKLLYWK